MWEIYIYRATTFFKNIYILSWGFFLIYINNKYFEFDKPETTPTFYILGGSGGLQEH